ncbi:HAMP domain-containing histidine kinase [Myxococcota bacterium]|nr:HAMP domain-containing histidine kinase [Myxococcota bacterium]
MTNPPQGAACDSAQALDQTLREAPSRALELAGGGLALLFIAHPTSTATARLRVRSAAGFISVNHARQAAERLSSPVHQCFLSGESTDQPPMPELGPRASAGLLLYPLNAGGRRYGVLIVGTPTVIPRASEDALANLAFSLAVQCDYPQLLTQWENSQKTLAAAPDERSSEEILRLSEKLFEQDIELLRHGEKLGEIEKVKSDFIEKMSRELRTPLNSIIESIVSVLAGEFESLSESARHALRRALDEGSVYQRTLENILDLWRIKQNELLVEHHSLNIGEVIEEAIFSVQETVGSKPVSIEKSLPEPLPRIKTDLAKLNQILFLLLDNAAKFTPRGSIRIVAELSPNRLICRIEDTGIGICADDQPYLFDEFFQVDPEACGRFRGAGLGLALVRELSSLLGGECQIESETGRGTIATVNIPVQIEG